MIKPYITPSIEVGVKQYEYPVYFDRKNICIHCGADNSLNFVDKFGNITKNDIHPFEYLQCSKCGTKYSILWQRDEKTGKMYPSAIDMNIKNQFINLVSNGIDYLTKRDNKERRFFDAGNQEERKEKS